MGFWMCVALVVGNIIGVSIFLLPASLAPYGFNALTGWITTVAGCLVLACVFAGLARRFPEADGPFGYIRETLGEIPAFAAVWTYWVSCWCANPVLATGATAYLKAAFPGLEATPSPVLALAALWLCVSVNLLGVRSGGRVQMMTTALKLVPMAGIVLLGLLVLASAPTSYLRHVPATPITLPLTMGAATLTLFAMLGLECATIPGRRVRDPARTIPRATIVGVLASAGIYIAVSVIPMLLLPQSALARSQAPFVDLMTPYLGSGVGRWLALFVVISALGALNGWTLVVGELTMTMGRSRILPSALGQTNRWGAPGAALIATGALASVLVVMNYSRSLVEAFTFLINVVTAASLPLYLLCSASLAVLGARRRPGWLVFGMAGVAYCVFVFIGVGWASLQWALALTLAGLPVLALQRLGRRRPRHG